MELMSFNNGLWSQKNLQVTLGYTIYSINDFKQVTQSLYALTISIHIR